MSFSVSYSTKEYAHRRWHRGSLAAPYDDWVRRSRPEDAIFTYSNHMRSEDILRYYFVPAERLAVIKLYVEFVCYFTVLIQLSIDDNAHTIAVERLLCQREDYWGNSEMSSSAMRSGSGGVGWYKENLEDLGARLVSLDSFVARFFASDWAALSLPMTRPKITPELIQVAEACPEKMGDCRIGPWGKTVGTYLVDRISAATTIQKHYRGWRVRMATAFNPNTTLGAFYVMRDFRQLLERPPLHASMLTP